MMAKRIFQRIPKSASGTFELQNTPETAHMLEWFSQMFPLRCSHASALRDQSRRYQQTILTLNQIVGDGYSPREFQMAIQPRQYQRQAAELFIARTFLLLADELGLGKTAIAITAMTDQRTLPVVVVCPAHLTRQWQREIKRFAPQLFTHVIKQTKPYNWPKLNGQSPDVLITSYHKLWAWVDALKAYCRMIIFDEGQELRHSDSTKYSSARQIAHACKYRLALSATPIYNYGGEIFNLLEVLSPGLLGTREEFVREWCASSFGDKPKLVDPLAFGDWMRRQHVMLRRTRRDVGRELPDLQRITQPIDSDPKALEDIQDKAGELARILLEDIGENARRMTASAQLDILIRQATGIGKAPWVAAFVELLLEAEEPVVLFGWHKAVYEIWRSRLARWAPAFYTGDETLNRKQEEVERFLSGQTKLLIVSLRSGAGLDGLQKRCRTVVFGELDWSHAVHLQCEGRVHRDGQTDPVTAYYLLADSGSDPLVAQMLGLKREQLDGIRGENDGPIQQVARDDGIRRLAERYLHIRR